MAKERGKRDESPEPPQDGAAAASPDATGEEATDRALGGLSELARRALGLGFAGFFLTEEAIRKALGDTVPRDWIDFAVDQSDRTRTEFTERLAVELAGVLETVDLANLAERLITGRTLEVSARIRLLPSEDGEDEDTAAKRFEFSIAPGSRSK